MCGDARATVVCVSGVVVLDGRILLVRQSPSHPLAGQWTLPWGHLDAGESPANAVLREIREEAGIEARVDGLLGVQELPPPWSGWVAIVYLCAHVAGTPHPEDAETDAARYFSRAELEALEEPIEPWSQWLATRVFDRRFTVTVADPTNPLQERGTYL